LLKIPKIHQKNILKEIKNNIPTFSKLALKYLLKLRLVSYKRPPKNRFKHHEITVTPP
jgi:hypothetical protein